MRLVSLATRQVKTVLAADSLDTAIGLMDEHGIHHLPVVDQRGPVGMLTDRDVMLAVGWKLSADRHVDGDDKRLAGPAKVGQIMSQPVTALSPSASVREAAATLVDRRIGAIPLVDAGKLCGIVTRLDLLRHYHAVVESEPSVRLLREIVNRHMRTNVITVALRDSLDIVVTLMHEHHLRHVPVVAEDMLIGIVSDRDIRRRAGIDSVEDQQSQESGRMHVRPSTAMDVMVKDVRTTTPETVLLHAVDLMIEHRIGSLPVVRGDTLVGIITDTDIVRLVGEADR